MSAHPCALDDSMKRGVWVLVGCLSVIIIPGLLFNAEYKRLNAEKRAKEIREGVNP